MVKIKLIYFHEKDKMCIRDREKNQHYAALTEQRTNAQADNPIESAKKIRLRMDCLLYTSFMSIPDLRFVLHDTQKRLEFSARKKTASGLSVPCSLL